MHTPRFSGQPASAGDLVFMRTASRPILTNCENVGTVVPLSRVIFHPESIRNGCAGDARLPQGAQTKWRESAVPVLKGLLRIRRYHQQETPYALQEVELIPWIQFGEAYSALRGWRAIPAALLSHSVLLCSGTEDNSLPTQRLQTSWSRPTQGKCFPDKHRSIGNKTHPVKSFATFAQLYLWKSITWHHSCLRWPRRPLRTYSRCPIWKLGVPRSIPKFHVNSHYVIDNKHLIRSSVRPLLHL